MSLLKKFLGDISARYLGLGGATGDSSNVLSVRGPGSLFDGDDAGHQIRVNKDATGDTASFLFQTGFSGRAEFGLIGNDDFELKVSANGSAFTQAWVIDDATGVTDFKQAPAYLGQNLYHTGDFTLSDLARRSGGNTFTGAQLFSGQVDVRIAGSFEVDFTTTDVSSHDVGLRIGGARTASSASDIAYIKLANTTAQDYDMAQIVAQDPSANSALEDGRLIFRTSDAGSLSDALVLNSDLSAQFYGEITVSGATVWHSNNDGAGSGLDADLLDGNQASAFAFLTGATFTGGVTAPTFSGNGANVTNVNAVSVGGIASGDVMRADVTELYTANDLDLIDTSKGSWSAWGNENPSNMPASAQYSSLLQIPSDTVSNNGGAQLLFDRNDEEMWVRFRSSGAYQTWWKTWHQGNMGPGSGLNADLLDGDHGSAFAKLVGATFTGGVTATTFGGDGGGLTNLNASNLASGTVPTARLPAVATLADQCSNSTGNFTMQVNDGGGNIGLRWNATPGGTSNLVEAGHAWELQIDNDSTLGDLTWYRGSSATGASGEAVTWTAWMRFDGGNDDIDLLKPLDLNGQALNNPGIVSVGGGDFTVSQTGGGVTNVIWWDVSAESLYLGSLLTSGDGKVEMRAPLVNTGHQTRVGELGVGGATPDATNTFAFYGTDLLLNSGGSINMKYNKNAVGNDASMTFQTAFSTKALMGLLGNDDFTLKVGSSFTTAMIADETDGTVSFPEGVKHDALTAYKTTAQTLTTTLADITSWDGTHVAASGNLSWNATTGQAFVGKAGRFLVSYSITNDATVGSNRSESVVELHRYDGSTWSKVAGSRHLMYHRLAGRGGTAVGWSAVLDLDATDGLKLQTEKLVGSDTVTTTEVMLSILRL